MSSQVAPKLYTDDVSLVVVLIDTNPFFWSTKSSLSFSNFLSHVLSFLNSILLLNQLNQVVVIATGYNSCDYIYDSSSSVVTNQGSDNGKMPAMCSRILLKLEEFVTKDERLSKEEDSVPRVSSSLLSGSLSKALCYIQRVFRAGTLHPQPRIICLHGSPDGPEQYVAVMNVIFSAQRSMVPIDSCVIGAQHSAFLQQASYITGGVYLKPQQLDGLFQFLSTVYATDLHSRNFLQLPKPAGVDFRASLKTFLVHHQVKKKKHSLSNSIQGSYKSASAIRTQSTWATSVLCVCLYSANITRNVQPVGRYLVKLKETPLLHQTGKGNLWRRSFLLSTCN